MRRIPRAFLVDQTTGLLTARPAFAWFAAGRGIASRKWDGLPCLLAGSDYGEDAGTFYRGFSGAEAPTSAYGTFIRTSDPADPEVRGWVPVSGQVVEDALYAGALSALVNRGQPIPPGTYELVGPSIKDNPEGVDRTALWRHESVCYLRCPRDLVGVIRFLAEHPAEGIVWRYGAEYCQVTRADVGLPWPAPMA
jgi:hypothetical protein